MTLIVDNESKFNEWKQKVASQTVTRDDRNVDLKPGTTFRGRLLYTENPDTNRTNPFIERWVHNIRKDDRYFYVVCPKTTGKSTKTCPICQNNRKLWDSAAKGSQTDKKLYDLHKTRLHGKALIFVINDPVHPEYNGHVKFLRYGKTERKFFNREIYGVVDEFDREKEKKINDEVDVAAELDNVGFDAFRIKGGFDLIITTTKKGQYNDYEYKFARKASDIEISAEQLNKEIEELKFDDETLSSTSQELDEYYKNHVLDMGTISEVETETKSEIQETKNLVDEILGDEDLEYEKKDDVSLTDKKKEEVKTEPPKEVLSEEDEIDKILNDVKL